MAIVFVSAEEEVEESEEVVNYLWADGSSKFDLTCVVVGVSFIAAGYWQHVWMYTDGI